MNIDPESKISILAISTIIFGLVWKISINFSVNNRTKNKFDQSEYRKNGKR